MVWPDFIRHNVAAGGDYGGIAIRDGWVIFSVFRTMRSYMI